MRFFGFNFGLQQKRRKSILLQNRYVEQYPQFPQAADGIALAANWHFQLVSLKESYLKDFIPAARKKANSTESLQQGSLKDIVLPDKYQEVLRQGYIAIYHKQEGFFNELYELLCRDSNVNRNDIEKYGLANYKLDFNGVGRPEKMIEIEFICNCCKHRNGHPIPKETKNPQKQLDKTPLQYIGADKSKPIELSEHEFTEHIDFLIDYFLSSAKLLASLRAIMIMDTLPKNILAYPPYQLFYDTAKVQLQLLALYHMNGMDSSGLDFKFPISA